MLEVLQFVFSSFWVWLGTLLLIAAPLSVLSDVFKKIKCKK